MLASVTLGRSLSIPESCCRIAQLEDRYSCPLMVFEYEPCSENTGFLHVYAITKGAVVSVFISALVFATDSTIPLLAVTDLCLYFRIWKESVCS